jgi:hypothetical protein
VPRRSHKTRSPKLAPQLTHFDRKGSARMVDVGKKDETHRIAVASGRIAMRPATFRMVVEGGAAKGDVLGVARIAAIQAAKRTSELIPLAHPIALTRRRGRPAYGLRHGESRGPRHGHPRAAPGGEERRQVGALHSQKGKMTA